ncbi:hypothetical protein CY652_03510 [Burkholderia sp. WAC0059]|uniref:hypothetical protein n=1 Tax=Burkholderia sp. WAC0059 TaxID=2066022 RepID=UPI000C7F7719|nr:hypothetical protein [Burkholderia sp. WAC0059]PLZ04047.1 hypothetical protein CY652_03510 [Burkholderia sp. WAC0059]
MSHHTINSAAGGLYPLIYPPGRENASGATSGLDEAGGGIGGFSSLIPEPSLEGTGDTAAGQLDSASPLLLEASADAAEAASNVGQFSDAFVQAMQSATTVDPTTGQSELQGGSASQLAAALNTMLVNAGFSATQAASATSSFEQQLAQGGEVNLSASFSRTTALPSANSGSGWQTMPPSAVVVNERSGSVSIQLDPGTGQLSVSLNEQQVSSYTATAQTTGSGIDAGLLVPTLSPFLMLLSSPGATGDGGSQTGEAEGDAQPLAGASAQSPADDSAASASGASSDDGTGDTSSGESEILDLLRHMADVANANSASGGSDEDAAAGEPVSEAGDASGAASGADTAGAAQALDASATITVVVGFSQALSIQSKDSQGYGTTLYQRPDGTTGAMSFEPLRTAA